LRTVSGNALIDKFSILENSQLNNNYNLWLEIDKFERFSYLFGNKKETPDNIIISSCLFDNKNISYVDSSFEVFKPTYLINNNVVNRWKRAKSGKAWHLGEGYSDHLPIYAYFTDTPFKLKNNYPPSLNKTIRELYAQHEGSAILRDAVIIYKNKNNCVIKREKDRAIYCYKCLDNFKLYHIYDLYIYKLKKFKSLPEITSAIIINQKGTTKDINKFYIKCDENTDYASNINEICSHVEGVYHNNFLQIGKHKIKLYINKNIKLKNNNKLILEKVRIGFFKEPELILEDFNQIRR
jgi:hypothetical protein